MEIVEGDGVASLEGIEVAEDDGAEDSKLYIAEHMLVEGGEMFTDSKAFVNLDQEQIGETEAIEHIIIDGQVSSFATISVFINATSSFYLYSKYSLRKKVKVKKLKRKKVKIKTVQIIF